MTRINVGIKPANLIDQHLLAELRELPRLYALSYNQNKNANMPPQFKLGPGHVLFFYDKMKYIHDRHILLLKEYVKRFNKPYKYQEPTIREECYNDYNPSENDRLLLVERICERIDNMRQPPRYFGFKLNLYQAKDLVVCGSINPYN